MTQNWAPHAATGSSTTAAQGAVITLQPLSAAFRPLMLLRERYPCYITASFLIQPHSVKLHRTRHPGDSALLLGQGGWDIQSRNDRGPRRAGQAWWPSRHAGRRAAAAVKQLCAHAQCMITKRSASLSADLLRGNVDLAVGGKWAEQGWTTAQLWCYTHKMCPEVELITDSMKQFSLSGISAQTPDFNFWRDRSVVPTFTQPLSQSYSSL